MKYRDFIVGWTQRLAPFLIAVSLIVIGGLAIAFLAPRGAAAVIGCLAGVLAAYFVVTTARHTAKIAIVWSALAVIADAAYARLNDQIPVTIANALVKIADALVKLAEPLLKGLGAGGADPRARLAGVTPDFVWAAILSLSVILIVAFLYRKPIQDKRAR